MQLTGKYGKSDGIRLIFSVEGENDLCADNTPDTKENTKNNDGNGKTADNSAQSDAKSGQKSSETSVEDALDAVNALVGAKEFKYLGAYVYYTEEL